MTAVPMKGPEDGRAGKLPPETVRRIRAQAEVAFWLRTLLAAQPTLQQIAEREGTTLRTVRGIVNRQRYAWVPDDPAAAAAVRKVLRLPNPHYMAAKGAEIEQHGTLADLEREHQQMRREIFKQGANR